MQKDTYRSIEITAVSLTVVGKLVYDYCKEQNSIIAATIIAAPVIAFWIVYLFIRLWKEEGIHKEWGFTGKNFIPAMICVGIVGAISICVFIIYGLVVHNTKFTINILYIVLVYPVWGLVQQFIFISLFAGNLNDHEKITIDKFLIVLITSVLFSALHTSDDKLMIVTFFMAMFCTCIFLKYKNLYPLGIFHGVVGAIFYYFFLNKDAWCEMICAICNFICK